MKKHIMKKWMLFLVLILLVTPLIGCFSDDGSEVSGETLEIDYLVASNEEDAEDIKTSSLLEQIRDSLSLEDNTQQETQIEEVDIATEDGEGLSFWEKLRLRSSDKGKDQELDLGLKADEKEKENGEIKVIEDKKVENLQQQSIKEKEEEKQKEEKKKKEDNNIRDNENNKPAEEDKEPEEEKPKESTVTLTIRCDTAVNKGMHKDPQFKGIVPDSGVILSTTTFKIKEGDTVLDVLVAARDKYKLHMVYSGTKESAYIEGINNLFEFDGGRWSGWMYCVNGWYPNYGAGVYVLQSGDVIEWNYTCDLGKDLGQDWLAN